MVYLRCTVPGRCPKHAINQPWGGGGGVGVCGGEGRLPPARSVFNISGDECNRMVEARGGSPGMAESGRKSMRCLFIGLTSEPPPPPSLSFFSFLLFSLLLSYFLVRVHSHSNKQVSNNIQGPLKHFRWINVHFITSFFLFCSRFKTNHYPTFQFMNAFHFAALNTRFGFMFRTKHRFKPSLDYAACYIECPARI